MVKAIINGVMTYYPGRHYNLSMDGETESIQKTYAFGALTIATRKDGELKWVLGDHLPRFIRKIVLKRGASRGSTSLTANEDGRGCAVFASPCRMHFLAHIALPSRALHSQREKGAGSMRAPHFCFRENLTNP